jgi:cob(I)alamin adenosyltransferase
MGLDTGLVEVYTGEGKGKTSAAFGLALRAVGRGLRVSMIQFIKGGFEYGELYVVDGLPNFTLNAFGRGKFITESPPSVEDVDIAEDAFNAAKKAVLGGEYDVVILDEINVAIKLDLIDEKEVLELIKNKPKNVEIVLTGRYASKRIIQAADLVTEFKKVKHPFDAGYPARKGIEF